MRYTFLERLELEAKFEKELLEEHADAHGLAISLFALLQYCYSHLDQTVGAQAAGEWLVEVLEAEELFEQERENLEFRVLLYALLDVLAAL